MDSIDPFTPRTPVIPRLPALTRRSLAVFATAVLVVVVGQTLVQRSLTHQRALYGQLGALARHRGAAGRVVRAALLAIREQAAPGEPATREAELRTALTEFARVDAGLTARVAPDRAATLLRDAVRDRRALIVAIDARVLHAARGLLERDARVPDARARDLLLGTLIGAERELAGTLTELQREIMSAVDREIERMWSAEVLMFLLLVGTLAVGATLVVRPAARSSERLMAELLASRARLQDANAEVSREREFATSLVSSASDAIFAFDRALRITAWNPAMERWTGVSRADALGRRPEEIRAEIAWGDAGRPYARALAGESVELQDRPGRAAPGEPERFFDASCVPLRGADGGITGGLVAIRDVTPRVVAAEQVRRSEARFHALFVQAPLGIVLQDDAGTIVDANPAFERLVGRPAATLRGTRMADLTMPEDEVLARAHLTDLRVGGRASVTIEQRLLRHDEQPVWASLTFCRVDVLGAGVTLMAMAQDVTARRELEARLSHQAYHDPLTGLANRAKLRERLVAALGAGERPAESIAVIYVDLDDFKKVNDSLGHAAGDRLLRVVAERLLNATRGCDTVARLGGDEFAILLENVRGDQDVLTVAERVVKSMRAAFSIEGREVFVGASVGMARAASDAARGPTTADELLRNADVAMYSAKRGGKGCWAMYERGMNADAMERLELEADLRHALERGQLQLHYQPIVELTHDRVIGVEALLRWAHPRRGTLLPAQFLALAEETGLIVPIGRWVLDQACRQGEAWLRRRLAEPGDPPFQLTVNISARQLHDGTLVSHVREALAASGFPPAQLLLEITESTFLQHDDDTLERMHAIKALGVRLGIDDFGTGYASLRYLQQFPVDVLKIDRSFVSGLDGSADGASEAALARAIIALGDTLSLRTVAEGIEGAAQREQLRRLGCELGQGYLFGHPLPASEIERLLGLTAGAAEEVGALGATAMVEIA